MTYAVNCSILLTEYPLHERAGRAADAGFDAVEFWWPFPGATPGDAEIAAFERAIRDAGVQLVALNLYGGDMRAGERGVLSLPARSREFADALEIAAGIGERLGCRAFNALYGNRDPGLLPQEQDAVATENLALAAATLARIGGTVLIEPLSGIADYPLKTSADVFEVIARVGAASGAVELALLADLYHLAVNGDDVDALIAADTARFGHVQIADSPGRGAPGSGCLPLGPWIGRIRAAGYRGRIGLEYSAPSATAFQAIAQLEADVAEELEIIAAEGES